MSIVRSLLGPGERAIRSKAIAERMFWQAPNDTPVFIRKAGDKAFYTASWAVCTGGFVFALLTSGAMALKR